MCASLRRTKSLTARRVNGYNVLASACLAAPEPERKYGAYVRSRANNCFLVRKRRIHRYGALPIGSFYGG
jgi:hypothetical protein